MALMSETDRSQTWAHYMRTALGVFPVLKSDVRAAIDSTDANYLAVRVGDGMSTGDRIR